MEMKSFEEYLEESKNKVFEVKLNKLAPSKIKKLYNKKKSFGKVLSYNELIEILNGNFKNFLSFTSCSSCDIYNKGELYLNLDACEVVSDNGNKTNIIYKNKLGTKICDVVIHYNDNDYIKYINYHNIFGMTTLEYVYDDKNRLIHYSDSSSGKLIKPYTPSPSIIYDDENQISYDKNSIKYTKYDNNQNIDFSVYFHTIDNNIVSKLKKYMYNDDGSISIVHINIFGDEAIPFEF